MIIREWRARASRSNPDAYPAHFHGAVLPELRDIPGFLGADLATRQDGGKIEFLVLTRWQSIEAIKAFAGPDIGRSVVEPAAAAALLDFDADARHYQVIEAA